MAEDARTWYLRQVDLFRGLAEPEIEALVRQLEHRRFARGELIIGPDTPMERVYVVHVGTVRLFHRGPDGREITVDLLGPGRLFGVSTLFGTTASPLLAEAVTEVWLCFGPAEEFLRLIQRWPGVLLGFIAQVGAQVVRTEQELQRVGAGDARVRLADALYRLARDAGEDVPGGGRRIGARLTHGALARQIGASRETVTRHLAALEAEGHLRREGRRLVVTDPARLREAYELVDDGEEARHATPTP